MKLLACTVVAVALLVPASFATSVDFANQGGTLAGSSSAGLSLTGSIVSAILVSPSTFFTGNLGSITFTTGSLASGSLDMGGTFSAGGAFAITGNGTDGIHNGTIFLGSFDGPTVWSMITLANGTHNYTLVGTVSGNWFSGKAVSGVTVQLTINTGKGFFNGSTLLSSGNTDIEGNGIGVRGVVPEPASLTLMGTGIVAMAGAVRRKFLKS